MQSKNTELVNKIQKVRQCKRSSARTYASTIVRVGNEFAKGGFNKNLKWVHQNSIYEKLKKTENICSKKVSKFLFFRNPEISPFPVSKWIGAFSSASTAPIFPKIPKI